MPEEHSTPDDSLVVEPGAHDPRRESDPVLSNAEIADRLASLAQLLSSQKENPYKVKAYRRAAAKIRTLSESLYELVQEEVDLTRYAGIGEAIASAIREVVLTGTLRKLETLARAGEPGARERQPVSAARPQTGAADLQETRDLVSGGTARETRQRRDRTHPRPADGPACPAGSNRDPCHAALPGG